jgi:hypothetical protein
MSKFEFSPVDRLRREHLDFLSISPIVKVPCSGAGCLAAAGVCHFGGRMMPVWAVILP